MEKGEKRGVLAHRTEQGAKRNASANVCENL